jgi:hypothetical protein
MFDGKLTQTAETEVAADRKRCGREVGGWFASCDRSLLRATILSMAHEQVSWRRLAKPVRTALANSWSLGVPPEASAFRAEPDLIGR